MSATHARVVVWVGHIEEARAWINEDEPDLLGSLARLIAAAEARGFERGKAEGAIAAVRTIPMTWKEPR